MCVVQSYTNYMYWVLGIENIKDQFRKYSGRVLIEKKCHGCIHEGSNLGAKTCSLIWNTVNI